VLDPLKQFRPFVRRSKLKENACDQIVGALMFGSGWA
jgi:hypothetical protein